MPKFEVRLESQTDSQARIVSVDAADESVAREVAARKEIALVNFSLLPPVRDVWECPPGGPDSPDGLVDLARWDAYDPKFAKQTAQLPYGEAVSAAKRRLSGLENRIDVAPAGKVRGSSLSARAQARVLAHRQSEPYVVADVRRVDESEVEAQRAVRALAALKQDPEAWETALKVMRDGGIPLAAVTATLGGLAWQKQIDGSSVSVFSSAAVQCSLHTAYTFNNDTHDFFDDARATEITGTGYTANGVTLASKASTYDTATDQIRLDAADVSWTTSTLSATDAVIWVNTAGADSTDPLWGNVDFGATVSTTAGTFAITWDATGVVVFDVT